jgi:hypothetical protein
LAQREDLGGALSLADQQKPCDMPSVRTYLDEHKQLDYVYRDERALSDKYLLNLVAVLPVVDPRYQAQTIQERWRERQFEQALHGAQQRRRESTADLETQLQELRDKLDRIPGADDQLSIEAITQRPGVYTRDQLDHLPPREDAIEGLLTRRGLVLIAAWRGSGKSFLALAIAGAFSAAQSMFWDRKVKASGWVVYVCHEGADGIQERVKAWEKINGVRTDHILWWTEPMDITDDQMRATLGLVARSLSAVAIILDPARTTGFKSEDTKDGAAYALALGLLKRSFGGVVVVLHNSGYDRTRERGSTTLGDACDQVFNIVKKPGGVRLVLPGRLRDNREEDDALMVYRIDSVPGTQSAVLVRAKADLAESISDLRDRIFKLIEASPGMTTAKIAEHLGMDPSNTSDHLAALERDGRIVNRGAKNKKSWHPCDPSQALV